MADAKYEGVVEYFELTNKMHSGPSGFSKEKMPVVRIGIRSQEGVKEFELPINVPNNPFSVRLIEDELAGERASYELRHDYRGTSSGMVWEFRVHSGKFEGVNYTLDEVVDY